MVKPYNFVLWAALALTHTVFFSCEHLLEQSPNRCVVCSGIVSDNTRLIFRNYIRACLSPSVRADTFSSTFGLDLCLLSVLKLPLVVGGI